MDKGKNKIGRHYLSLFFNYALLLLVFYFLYVSTVLRSDYRLGRDEFNAIRREVENESISVMESIAQSASGITSRINYSLSFRDSYLTLVSGEELSAKDRTTIIQELRSAYAWSHMTDIEEVVLFIDNSDIALSSSGIIQLDAPFRHHSFPTAYYEVSTISSLLGVSSSRFTFQDENIIYLMGFKYQGGSERGTICISYNREKLEKKLESILKGEEYVLLFAENALLGSREEIDEGNVSLRQSSESQKLRLMINQGSYHWKGPNSFALYSLIIGSLLFIVILVLYLLTKRKYTESIKNIRKIIPVREPIGNDEINSMINDLKGVLLENDSYRERLDGVSEYVERGFFSLEVESEKDRALLMEHLGFVRPYFLVLAMNVDGEEISLDSIFDALKVGFEDDSTSLYFHKRDYRTAFMVINSDALPDEEIVAEKVRMIAKATSSSSLCLTLGVDVPRQDFMDFKKSCTAALEALKIMLVQGKDDIYFSCDEDDDKCEYYIPTALDIQISNLIRQNEGHKIKELFDSILSTNLMKYDLTASSVLALSDELYYTELKVLRSIGEGEAFAETRRADKYLTIEEVVAYYTDYFLSLVSKVGSNMAKEDHNYAELMSYIDENYSDPEISLKALGERFSLSTKSIGNYISLRFHMTYLEYITQKRMQKAITLLNDGKTSIDDVAKMCGYSSALSFRRNFKDTTGVTPSEYKARCNS